MTERERLVSDTRRVLVRAEFATSDPKDLIHSGFDIVARKGPTILIIKIMANANSLNDSMLASMKALANALDGAALLIAVKSGNDAMEDGVTYSRSGIPLISFQTFSDLVLDGIPPLVYAASGGFYVNIDADILRKVRDGGVSLGDMADMAGVSRRTIKMYEDGMGAKMEVAIRLEEGLGIELIVPQDPIKCNKAEVGGFREGDIDGIARDIFKILNSIGYSILPVPRCPFDAVTRDEEVMLFAGVDKKTPGLDRRARAMANLSRILEKHPVMFVDRLGERVNLEGTPLIGSGELKNARDKKKLVELIEERY